MNIDTNKNTFNPDYAISPGFILEEILESRNISQTEFAQRCGRPIKTIHGIIHGNVSIIEKTALEFEKVLNINATTWLNLENTYKIFRLKEEEKKIFEKKVGWAKKFPIGELVKRNFIKKQNSWSEKVDSLLKFFGVSSVEAFEDTFLSKELSVQFKLSPAYKSSPESIASWLRMGEIYSQKHSAILPYDESKFKLAVSKARDLTTKPDINNTIKIIKEEFAKVGVVLVLMEQLPRVPISGSARWISSDKALIQLSLRHKSDDHFWFSLFHECGHIILHKKKVIYIDLVKNVNSNEEKEADQYSRDTLISMKSWNQFVHDFSKCHSTPSQKKCIQNFAENVNIARGIIIGRLQHEKYIPYFSIFNKDKVKLAWSS